jgi:hypothetical protein
LKGKRDVYLLLTKAGWNLVGEKFGCRMYESVIRGFEGDV